MARPKKKKNTRTDAALDAMRPYGFPDRLILKHLKQLLQVYGDDNWFFIEENSYKVLLEALLEQPEEEHHQALVERLEDKMQIESADTGNNDVGDGPILAIGEGSSSSQICYPLRIQEERDSRKMWKKQYLDGYDEDGEIEFKEQESMSIEEVQYMVGFKEDLMDRSFSD